MFKSANVMKERRKVIVWKKTIQTSQLNAMSDIRLDLGMGKK